MSEAFRMWRIRYESATITSKMEKWTKIKGFDGYSGASDWEVSDQCNVRQFGAPIEPKVDSQGYRYIQFCKGGELQRVHRLMLFAFHGEPEPGQVAVNVQGAWRWGPRDMVHIPKRKEVPLKTPKPKRTKRRKSFEHFDAWFKEYKRLENS